MLKLHPGPLGLLAALAVLAAPAVASARDVVTAENVVPHASGRAWPILGHFTGGYWTRAAQTFTARTSGALTRIDALVEPITRPDVGLKVSLLAVGDDGRPVGFPPADEVAGGFASVEEAADGTASVAFADGPRLVAGQRYAVGLSSLARGDYWAWRVAEAYADGAAFFTTELLGWRPLRDIIGDEQFAFRVVIDAPYDFGGFRPPLAGGDAVTTVKAGRAVPVKFSLGGIGSATLGSAASRRIACPGAASGEPVAGEAPADGPRGLVYDAAVDEYSFVWKTGAAWAGSCREFALTLDDGVARTARFRFVR